MPSSTKPTAFPSLNPNRKPPKPPIPNSQPHTNPLPSTDPSTPLLSALTTLLHSQSSLLALQATRISTLNQQIENLTSQLPPHHFQNLQEADESTGLQIAQLTYGPNAEVILLRETVERLRSGIEILKTMKGGARGRKQVSEMWEASLREQLRREREKDAWVIRGLRREIEMLKGEKKEPGR